MFYVLGSLAVLSVFLAVWQWVAAVRFPLERRQTNLAFNPAVTILKPLKGLDDNTIHCLRTWLANDYPAPVQILCGVADLADPVCAAVRQLIREYPGRGLELVHCSESLGVNRKVSSLIQLLPNALHEVIIVSDADVAVPSDFLRHIVVPLREPGVGLVNCFYRLANPATLAMRCEAVAINADFWSQVLQGRSLQPLDFALGAVMAARRDSLDKIGGFAPLADYLADDYHLGNRIVHVAGQSIALCPVVVDCLSPPTGWRGVWSHQLRWARTIRVSKPLPYAFSILSNATLWPLLWLAVRVGQSSLIFFAAATLLRIVSAVDLQHRLGAVRGQRRFAWLAPIKDLMQFALWLAAFAGNHIVWREHRYRLRRDGKLVAEH